MGTTKLETTDLHIQRGGATFQTGKKGTAPKPGAVKTLLSTLFAAELGREKFKE